jgi:hypothetical protein
MSNMVHLRVCVCVCWHVWADLLNQVERNRVDTTLHWRVCVCVCWHVWADLPNQVEKNQMDAALLYTRVLYHLACVWCGVGA